MRRGIMLSFLSAFFQALSAIAIVGVIAIALDATSLQITAAGRWIETVSWGLFSMGSSVRCAGDALRRRACPVVLA